MKRIHFVTLIAILITAAPAHAQSEATRKVDKGGVAVEGWKGAVDKGNDPKTLNDAKLEKQGEDLHVTTGPAVAYWNPANKAAGDYTVSASFTEPKYMNLNDHPHPYGVFIGGNDLGTDKASYLYCAAYGTGKFIVRGFGPEPFQMNGRRPEENAAVHKAAGQGEPVTQDVALSVKGDKVECSINGTVVASYAKADVVGDGKLKSTDGVYGIRFAHNTEGVVKDLMLSKK